MSDTKLVGKAAQAILLKFPKSPTKTLATKLFKDNPRLFRNAEHARDRLRYYRGAKGKRCRAVLASDEHVIPHRKPGELLHRLPEGLEALPNWKPLQLDYPTNALILSDMHVPFHNNAAVLAAVKDGIAAKCDTVILNGDFMDCFAGGFYRKDPRDIDFKNEILMGVAVLEWLCAQFPKARIIFKEGNHDERLEAYLIDKAPILLDLAVCSWPSLLQFDRLKIEHVKNNRPIRVGKLNILHGHEYRFIFSPVNPARGLYLRAQVHALCGHLHKNSHHSEPNLEGKSISTWSVGCLCDLRPKYDPLAKWQHGAARVKVLDKDGTFHVTPLRIIDGKIY